MLVEDNAAEKSSQLMIGFHQPVKEDLILMEKHTVSILKEDPNVNEEENNYLKNNDMEERDPCTNQVEKKRARFAKGQVRGSS